jgi:hypothetical protein
MAANLPGNQFDYYVSLDLGSETMAAYYEHATDGNDKGSIDLQAHAKSLLGGPTADPDYLLDADGTISRRLRTRIALLDRRQGDPLPDTHALLDFIDNQGNKLPGYDESLFLYFFNKNQTKAFAFMPNPKVPFQEGGERIIPKVIPQGGSPGVKVTHSAETLLQHLITQVVRNFVLKSPTLRNTPSKKVHLTLTMPNVYSPTHAESIRNFVYQHAGVHDVDVLYESDAVAYFLHSDEKDLDPPDIRNLRTRILNRKDEKLRIATIDIGRGTSDLSLIQIEKPERQGGERRHYVLARTGKSSGGNGLSYIFAEYYNQRLEEVLHKHRASLPAIPPFNFLAAQNAAVFSEQWDVLVKLENLIQRVKESMTDKYRLELSEAEQRSLIEGVVVALLKAIDPMYSTTSQSNNPVLDQFAHDLTEAMVLPTKGLSTGTYLGYLKQTALKGISKLSWLKIPLPTFAAPKVHIPNLRRDIEKYVNENVDSLIQQLKTMALLRENSSRGSRHKQVREIFDKQSTFVLIAGQGAQFNPIRRAIRNQFPRINFPKENVGQIDKKLAKEVCCIGAVDFQASNNRPENISELHGVYGFLARSPLDKKESFKKVNMSKVRSGGVDTLTFRDLTEYRLIYSQNPTVSTENPPRLHDGFTALIGKFRGSRFRFEYDPKSPPAVPEIKVNGAPIAKIANFGDINESIWPKVWPEVVKPI